MKRRRPRKLRIHALRGRQPSRQPSKRSAKVPGWAPFCGLVAGILGALLLQAGCCAAAECADGPPPDLAIHRLSAGQRETRATTQASIEATARAEGRERPLHPLMVINHELETYVAVEHHIVETQRGFCDEPPSVRLEFGLTRREALIAREAQHEPCVKDALLAHETEHTMRMEQALDVFLGQRLL